MLTRDVAAPSLPARWLLDAVWGPGFAPRTDAIFAPGDTHLAADVVRTADGYRLEVEVPGLTREQIHVEIEAEWLTIRTEPGPRPKPGDGEVLLSAGRMRRATVRRFLLPEPMSAEGSRARLENGVMVLELVRSPNVRARRVEFS